MATSRFETTLKALKEGAQSFTIDKATSNIEGWEEYLSKHDHEGVKKVVADLGKLKKLLHAKELDGEAIKSLVQKLGKETVAVAGDDETATAGHIKELGEALSERCLEANASAPSIAGGDHFVGFWIASR